MAIAGHVSKQMLEHYSHVRMEAKRAALESAMAALDPPPPRAPAALPKRPPMRAHLDEELELAGKP